jgi:hypothetical protein
MAEPRRTRFGSIVLAGLATAALTAVASGKAWFRASIDYKLMPGVPDPDKAADMPLALALSLVVLAGWGTLLVSRGRVRRAVAGVALLAAAGVVACAAVAPFTLPDRVRGQLPAAPSGVGVSPTGWFITAAAAAVLSTAVLVLAWLRSSSWPTMSSRYDAPGTAEPEIRSDTDLWKAMDEGRDPTDNSGPRSP